MSVFHFRQFDVRNERSAMKVNTDGVILGAAMTVLPSDRRMLDVGTGTGAVALMTAQRLFGGPGSGMEHPAEAAVRITGIDIDAESAWEAAENFAASPWRDAMESLHLSLEEYAGKCPDETFDCIFSNPPYFETSLKAPEQRRRTARHAETMSWRDVADFAAARLVPGGRLSIIIPHEAAEEAVSHAAAKGLSLFRAVEVRGTAHRAPMRSVLEFILSPAGESSIAASVGRMPASVRESLCIQDSGRYTPQYIALVSPFLPGVS